MIPTRARWLASIIVAAALLAGCAFETVKSPPGTTTTLILLRHAERNPLETDLNSEGRARAATLPRALAGVPIDAIYSPDISRNLDTAAPLAKQRGLTVKVIEPSSVAARLIGENPGRTVVWVGNSGNLKEIWRDIDGPGEAPVYYGNLDIVRVPDKGPVRVTNSHYGR